MKKALAIVLALVMVLCMIPAVFADSTKNEDYYNKSYDLKVGAKQGGSGKLLGEAKKANSVTAKYEFGAIDAVETGKWSDAKKMALVAVSGFEGIFPDGAEVLIDGMKLDVDKYADYAAAVGFDRVGYHIHGKGGAAYGVVVFPVELTKDGYSDTFVITVVNEKDGVKYTETAKISVVLKNTEVVIPTEELVIKDIVSADAKVATAYIVGSKIYVDYVAAHPSNIDVTLTFAKANGAAFSEIAYARRTNVASFELKDWKSLDKDLQKLDKSAAKFTNKGTNTEAFKFFVETQATNYETAKKYEVVNRFGIKGEDPKGIYFAEAEKTIAVGEEYMPVVKALSNGKSFEADKAEVYADANGYKLSTDIVDHVAKNSAKLIGTKPGVAYIYVTYTPAGALLPYTATQKITVVAGKQVPPTTTTYYVTCRNLNVRKGPGTSYAKAGMIHRGDAVEVVEIKNNWALLNNGTYVSANYITK